MPLRSGVSLGRYEVQDYMGRDELGVTFRGYDSQLAQPVAIRSLEALRDDPDALARFDLLGPRLVGLEHPNLISVLDSGRFEGDPYLVRAYVQGGSLAERRERGTITRQLALDVLGGVGGAVDRVHQAGIVHGELAPECILMDFEEHSYVDGFGIASLRGRATGAQRGNLDYTAPERLLRGELSAAVDRYSFAALAYDLLAGAPPFQGRPAGELPSAIESALPPAPSSRNPELNTRVDSVVLRGLAKDPYARWQTCGQLVQALREAVGPEAPAAAAAVVEEKEAKRRWWPWILAGVAALLVVAGLLFFFLRQSPSPSLSLAQASGKAGDSVTLRASHLPANQTGTVQFQSSPQQIGVFQADSSGNVLATATVPTDASIGDHLVSLCYNGSCPAGTRFTVTGPAPTPTPSSTPAPTPPPTPTPTPPPTPTPTPAPPPTPTPTPPPTPTPSAHTPTPSAA
jgi:serine/threonine protein kinase